MLAGRIDVQFRVIGSKGMPSLSIVSHSYEDNLTRFAVSAGGTASFTSIRRGKQGRFEVLRWKVTRDDGTVLDLQGLDFGELEL